MISEIIFNYVSDKLFVYQALATLTTFTAIRLVLFIQIRRKRFQLFKYHGIPGPEPRVLDGNLYMYHGQTDKMNYLIEEKLTKQYGKVFGFFIGDEPSMIITDLDILRQIFFEKMSSFKERAPIFLESPLTRSVLFARHNKWKWMRKIMSPAFNTYRMRGESSTQFIEDGIKLMVEYIETKFEQKSPGGKSDVTNAIELDVHSIMKATALKLISSIAIDLPNLQVIENESHVESLDSYLAQADSGAVIAIIKFPFLKPIMQFLADHFEHGKTLALVNRGLNKTIDEGLKRLALKQAADQDQETRLIDKMIQLHHEGKLTRDEVIGNAEAILFAGYDTTSTSLTYIFWVLGKHLDIQERLRGELMAHGIDSAYLEQVINETLRLYPTVISFVTRTATENVTINNWTIPSGTRVIYNSWLMGWDANLWPEPAKFDPERFRAGVDIHPCAFAPFGLGERKCLGYQLAKLELKMVTCDILMRYKLTTKAPAKLELVSCATVLSKPREPVVIEMRRL